MARIPDFDLYASGISDSAALLKLKHEIVSTHDRLEELGPEQLGPMALQHVLGMRDSLGSPVTVEGGDEDALVSRKTYPRQWLVIEALDAHTTSNSRYLDRIAVVETCPDGTAAMQSYRRLHKEYPAREFYFVTYGAGDSRYQRAVVVGD